MPRHVCCGENWTMILLAMTRYTGEVLSTPFLDLKEVKLWPNMLCVCHGTALSLTGCVISFTYLCDSLTPKEADVNACCSLHIAKGKCSPRDATHYFQLTKQSTCVKSKTGLRKADVMWSNPLSMGRTALEWEGVKSPCSWLRSLTTEMWGGQVWPGSSPHTMTSQLPGQLFLVQLLLDAYHSHSHIPGTS